MSKGCIVLFQTSLYFLSYPREKGIHTYGSKNDIESKNNILLFFVVYIQLMIFVALPATLKPKQR